MTRSRRALRVRAMVVGTLRFLVATLALWSVGLGSHERTSPRTEADDASLSKQLYAYVVGCALPRGSEITRSIDGQVMSYAGEFGFAPGWGDRALSLEEQRRVTACVLARTNRLGKRVRIELVSAHQALRGGLSKPFEGALWEGGFFGNLFADPPQLYACSGKPSVAEQASLVRIGRDCAMRDRSNDSLSRCGFRFVGICDHRALRRSEGDYSDSALLVFLDGHAVSVHPSALSGLD